MWLYWSQSIFRFSKRGCKVYIIDGFGVNNLITLIDNKDNVPHQII